MPDMHDTTGDMSRDVSHDTTSHDRQHDTTRRDSVSVNDAAHVLGITPDAVRVRLRRGSLMGEKVGTSWYVFLPDVDLDASVARHDTIRRDNPRQSSRDTTPRDTTVGRDELVEHLQGEVAYLRERLEEADRQQARMLGQLADERQRADVLQLRAIGSGAPDTSHDTSESPRSDDTVLQALRTWWRRLWGA